MARGTYYPPNVRSGSFVLPQGVSVIGGFAGNETELDQRDLSENPTILSGNIGSETHSADNSHHVLVPLNDSLLDGFIIEDGNATENFNDDRESVLVFGRKEPLFLFVIANSPIIGLYKVVVASGLRKLMRHLKIVFLMGAELGQLVVGEPYGQLIPIFLYYHVNLRKSGSLLGRSSKV